MDDPDLPLIETLQAGGDLALNELIQRHREPLFRFAFRYLRDETASYDVAQETFVRAYFKVRAFRPRSTVKTWLYTIAANLCKDRLRRLGTGKLVSLDARDGSAAAPEPADNRPTPAEQTSRTEQFQRLERAIQKLPEQLRVPLILCVLEGQSHKEAGEILRTSPKSVELRIYHAKARLRELMAAEG